MRRYRTVAHAFKRGLAGRVEFVSPPWRARESFLSPAEAGSQSRSHRIPPGSKPGATVLTPAPPTELAGDENASAPSCHRFFGLPFANGFLNLSNGVAAPDFALLSNGFLLRSYGF